MKLDSSMLIDQVSIFDDFAIDILRLDQMHPEISGNKWFKLKYNVEAFKEGGFNGLLTFGGAYSNHIAAVAAAGKVHQIKTLGVIRGEEHLPLNDTLELAVEQGMEIRYCDRATYRNIKSGGPAFEDWFGEHNFYVIPEGGSNELAVKGCMEILDERTKDHDLICCAVGTGATLAGIILSASKHQKVLGFSALKGGEFLKDDVNHWLDHFGGTVVNWSLELDAHRGGYAKVDDTLKQFVHDFHSKHGIQLDYIYTGKMLLRLMEMLNSGEIIKDQRILVIHTGGVQGNKGFDK